MKYINTAIDSLTVLTPLIEFTEINARIFDEVAEVNLETSEILSSSTKPILMDEKGIKLRAMIVNLFGKRFLSVTYTSKILMHNYFDGINMSNFRQCFDFVSIAFGFQIDYNNYLASSLVNDIDFKTDFYCSDKQFHSICDFYSTFPSAKTYYTSKADFLDNRMITGLQFVNRKDASVRSPFVKFYSKQYELEERSSDFKEAFLKKDFLVNTTNLRRLETTIKNRSHFKSFSNFVQRAENQQQQVNSLRFVLAFDITDIMYIIEHNLSRYTAVRPHEVELREFKHASWSPTDHLILETFMLLMNENNMSLTTCLSLLDTYPSLNDTTKHRIKKRLKDAFKEFLAYKGIRELKVTAKDAFI